MGKNIDDIALELKLTYKQIEKVIEKHCQINEQNRLTDKQKPVNSKSKQLMQNQTLGKHLNTVSIMTKEASEYNDSLRNKLDVNKKQCDHIFRPND